MPSVLHLKAKITKFARFHFTNILYFDFQHDPIFRVTVEIENNLRGRCLDSLWCCMRYWLTGERIYNPKKISVFLGLDQVTVIRSTVDKKHLPAPAQSRFAFTQQLPASNTPQQWSYRPFNFLNFLQYLVEIVSIISNDRNFLACKVLWMAFWSA